MYFINLHKKIYYQNIIMPTNKTTIWWKESGLEYANEIKCKNYYLMHLNWSAILKLTFFDSNETYFLKFFSVIIVFVFLKAHTCTSCTLRHIIHSWPAMDSNWIFYILKVLKKSRTPIASRVVVCIHFTSPSTPESWTLSVILSVASSFVKNLLDCLMKESWAQR